MKYIFIDGGARVGEAIDIILEKRNELEGCDVYLFECNDSHFETLNNIKKNNKKYNFTVMNEALWDSYGIMDFYISKDIWGDLGCTLDPTKREKLDLLNPKKVKTIRFSDFINNFSNDDYIIVKLDIEGAEYNVVSDLLMSGAINKINELYIEWHDHFFNKSSHNLKKELSKLNIIVNNNWM
jgi:FkbM family methyltransferase